MVTLSQTVAITFTIGLLFSLYLVTVCSANRWLLFVDEGWKLRKRHRWTMVITTDLIATLILTDVILAVRMPMAQMTFVEEGNKPEDWKDPPWDPIIRCMIANTVALTVDVVLMYRLWVTHAHQIWVMLFPIFLWAGGVVCTILQLFLQIVHIHNPNFGPYHWAAVNMVAGPGIVLTPFWASTIALNAYCTGMLIWRIWGASKDGYEPTFAKQLQFLVRILMESGVLYLSISIAHFFVWFGHNTFAVYLLGGMNTCMIGIAFNLILIRTAQNRADGEKMSGGDGGLTTIRFGSVTALSVQVQSGVESDSARTADAHVKEAA